MKIALFLVATLSSISCFATEVSCFTDYHVLAHYQDHSGLAIEREQSSFVVKYEKEKQNFYETTLHGRQVGAMTGPMFDSRSTGGNGDFIQGVALGIMSPKTQDWSESQTPIEAKMAQMTMSLRRQPGILPNEVSRDYFWSIACRW